MVCVDADGRRRISADRQRAHGPGPVGGAEAVAGLKGHRLVETPVDLDHDAAVVTMRRMNFLPLVMRLRTIEFHWGKEDEKLIDLLIN